MQDNWLRWRLAVLALTVEGSLGLIAWLLGWLSDQSPLAEFRWEGRAVLLGTASCVPMLLFFLVCARWPIAPLARSKQFVDEVVRPLFARSTVLDLALISLAAGVGEEMFFRGFLQALLVRWMGAPAGLLITSVVFGLLHLITPTYAVMATIMGMYLGVCYLADGNLLTVIVAHAAYDFIALVYLMRESECKC